METRELKLVGASGAPAETAWTRHGPTFVLAGIVLSAALVATWSGADDARRKVDTRKTAETTLQLAFERGRDDPEVRSALPPLRRPFGRRPLDARTRVVYASLLLGISSTVDELRLAAFHARRAAELAPVTVPVVRAAALVLAHTGEAGTSRTLIREMFAYDAESAAQLLSQVMLLFTSEQVESAIPETPEAWMTWARQFRLDGRVDDARIRERLTERRWPDHLPALERVASRALQEGDLAALAELVPPDRDLPQETEAAPAFLARALERAGRGERAGAVADIETAIRLNDASPFIQMYAGDVYQTLDAIDEARDEWNRALHLLRAGHDDMQRHVLLRLARLEEGHGRPAAALRLWNSLLKLDPDHAEARRRVDDLTGFQR